MELSRKGIMFVLLTALVSGFSIFLNRFAMSGVNAGVFAFLKNAVVVVFLLAGIGLLKELPAIKSLSRRQWAKLVGIGLIGGSIPFLLFFNALKITSAVNAAFVHKTLFIWVALLAVLFLGERVNRKFIAGAGLLLAGIVMLFGINIVSFGAADLMILLATLLWAGEAVLSKHVLKELSGRIVAFGRMFFGAGFILVFLLFSGEIWSIGGLGLENIAWIGITSLLLFFYVSTWYAGLKRLPAHIAASVLLLGLPITALLNLLFLGKAVSVEQGIGFVLIVSGLFVVVGAGAVLKKLGIKNLTASKHSF